MGQFDLFKSEPEPMCPSCNQPIEALLKRSGTCIHCKQKYYMCKDPEDGKYIFTNTEGKKAIEIKKRHFVDLINSRNNKASFESAMSLYPDIKKKWMTSDLPGVRDSHQAYEALGAVDMNYEYAPGLKFPGDPDYKDQNELDECRCTIVYDFD